MKIELTFGCTQTTFNKHREVHTKRLRAEMLRQRVQNIVIFCMSISIQFTK